VIAVAAIVLSGIVFTREKCSMRAVYIAAAVAALSLVGLLAHRFVVYGELVPNTYFAKAGVASVRHANWGIQYVIGFAKKHAIVLFLAWAGGAAALFTLCRKRVQHWPWVPIVLCGFVLAYGAYVVKVGGDNHSAFPYWRHLVHIAAFIVFSLTYALTRLWPRARHFHLLLVLVVSLVTNIGISDKSLRQSIVTWRASPLLSHTAPNQYVMELERISEPDSVVASTMAGVIPYFVDAIHIDTLGLNDTHIAKHGTFDPRGPQDSKTDMAWVMEQRPDLLEGYIPASLLLTETSEQVMHYIQGDWRSKMHEEMVSSCIFQNEYMLVRNWPYDDLDKSLFIRASYARDHCLVDELDCIPAQETHLGVYGRKQDCN